MSEGAYITRLQYCHGRQCTAVISFKYIFAVNQFQDLVQVISMYPSDLEASSVQACIFIPRRVHCTHDKVTGNNRCVNVYIHTCLCIDEATPVTLFSPKRYSGSQFSKLQWRC